MGGGGGGGGGGFLFCFLIFFFFNFFFLIFFLIFFFQERDYTIVSGAKRKTETYEAEDAETVSFKHLIDKESEQKIVKNDIEKLEKEEVIGFLYYNFSML